MRLLDRYLLRTFLMPWLTCLLGFAFLLILVDLVDQLNDFLDGGAGPGMVLLYYIRFLPTIWIYVGPVTLLLGTLYCFYQLTRNNEVIAMRASGISLHRILRPFLALGVLFSLLSIHMAENISPRSLGWTEQFLQKLKNPDSRVLSRLRFRDPESNRTWDIHAFEVDTGTLRQVNIWQRRPGTDSLEYHLRAESAVWMDTYWFFRDVTLQPHSEEGHRVGPPQTFSVLPRIEITESPDRILRETQNFDYMTSREMRQYLDTRPSTTSRTRARLLTQLSIRRAQGWMCLVSMLLAAPFATQTARKGVFTGVMLCLGLFFAMFFAMNLFKALGLGMRVPPLVAGWAPPLLFGGLGLHLVRKLR